MRISGREVLEKDGKWRERARLWHARPAEDI